MWKGIPPKEKASTRKARVDNARRRRFPNEVPIARAETSDLDEYLDEYSLSSKAENLLPDLRLPLEIEDFGRDLHYSITEQDLPLHGLSPSYNYPHHVATNLLPPSQSIPQPIYAPSRGNYTRELVTLSSRDPTIHGQASTAGLYDMSWSHLSHNRQLAEWGTFPSQTNQLPSTSHQHHLRAQYEEEAEEQQEEDPMESPSNNNLPSSFLPSDQNFIEGFDGFLTHDTNDNFLYLTKDEVSQIPQDEAGDNHGLFP